MRQIFFLNILYCALGFSDACDDWFKKSKVKPNTPDCLIQCATLPVSMGTATCSQRCEKFCNPQSTVSFILGRFLYYPGLTFEERKLVQKYPDQALVVYQQKGIAEKETMSLFHRDKQDDESDAYRHFLWAGLLAKELGAERAKEFLDAHESDGDADDPHRAMDLANNRAGLVAAEKLRKEGALNLEGLQREAMDAFKKNTLIVLKPEGGLPK